MRKHLSFFPFSLSKELSLFIFQNQAMSSRKSTDSSPKKQTSSIDANKDGKLMLLFLENTETRHIKYLNIVEIKLNFKEIYVHSLRKS